MEHVIIGGGPAGVLTGVNLLNNDEKVVIYDKNSSPGNVSCSGIISKKALAKYSKYVKLEILNNLSRAVVWFGNEKVILTPPRDKHAVVINRPKLNNDLLDLFISKDGKFVRKNMGITELIEMDSDVIIGADGPSSTVAQAYGFPKFSRVFNTAQVVVTGLDKFGYLNDEVHILLGIKGMFGWISPRGDEFEIGLATFNNPRTELITLLKRIGIDTLFPLVNKAVYHVIPFGPRERFGKTVGGKGGKKGKEKRVYLVGDAAGHSKPTTGGGLYYSCLSAELLSDCIIRRISPEDYETQWKKKYGGVFSKMRIINTCVNLVPYRALPFLGKTFRVLKIDKFISQWGDMEYIGFLNMTSFIKFLSNWSSL